MSRIHGITSDGGYPAGAEYSSKCPWIKKQGTEEIEVCVSITFNKIMKVEVPCHRNNVDLEEATYEIIEKDINHLEKNGWIENEIVTVEN